MSLIPLEDLIDIDGYVTTSRFMVLLQSFTDESHGIPGGWPLLVLLVLFMTLMIPNFCQHINFDATKGMTQRQ